MTIESTIRPLHHAGNSNETVIDRPIESTAETAIRFDRFHVLPHSRKLLADGYRVDLGSRAFDLLLALLSSNGRLMTKEDLFARIWPNTAVSESNLRVQIAALRNVLGPDKGMIKSVSGRGYVFTAPTSTFEQITQDPNVTLHGDTSTAGSADQLLPPVSWTMSRNEGRSTVAIVDDDSDIREALGDLLRSVGLHAETFSSTKGFLQSSSAINCRCLILDVRLPERNGFDFYDDLVRAHVYLPVIFMSGYSDPPMSMRAMNAGAVEFLTKPIQHKDLLEAIQLAIKTASMHVRTTPRGHWRGDEVTVQ